MTGKVSVRTATADDIADLATIGMASFRTAYESWSEPDDLASHLQEHFSEEAVREALTEPGCHYLLAINGDTPAGLVKIRKGESPSQIPSANALELQQVYVHPDQQRFGVGGALLAAAFDYATAQGAEGVWLSVWRDAHWALNCYLKYGFEQVGEVDFLLGGTVYKDFLMWFPVTDRKSG